MPDYVEELRRQYRAPAAPRSSVAPPPKWMSNLHPQAAQYAAMGMPSNLVRAVSRTLSKQDQSISALNQAHRVHDIEGTDTQLRENATYAQHIANTYGPKSSSRFPASVQNAINAGRIVMPGVAPQQPRMSPSEAYQFGYYGGQPPSTAQSPFARAYALGYGGVRESGGVTMPSPRGVQDTFPALRGLGLMAGGLAQGAKSFIPAASNFLAKHFGVRDYFAAQ